VKSAVIFPGQGTQQPAMGAPWRDHPAWAVVEQAEAAIGEPLAPLLLDATAEELSRTRNAQLAVLVTSLIAWEAAREQLDPIAFAGHSLGQVTALIASGCLPFDDGVRLAARRAELTQAAADAHPGKMAALLGASYEQAEEVCTAAAAEVWVANDNAPGQVVIAGTPEGLAAGTTAAKESGVRKVMPLDVGGAFHTPLMQDATDALREELTGVAFASPTASVISNDDGRAYDTADGWAERSAQHVSVPVRWRIVQSTLVEVGAPSFIEIGHGNMLATLAKRTVPNVPVHKLSAPDDLDKLGGST
jgi:[acyl-carrier-protein] S-malonyltransferase